MLFYRTFQYGLFVAWVVYGLWGCANPLPLTGGEKDTIPPRMLWSAPATGTTHFQGGKLALYFSKPIQADNLREQLIIAPQIDGRQKLRYKVRGHRLWLWLNDSLQSATTYTLNANRAVQDLHEGLSAEGATFAFSTGPSIDSLSITGRVWDPYAPLHSPQTITFYSVGLTRHLHTDSLWNRDYEYLTRSDSSGFFQIPYLKQGKYLLHAFTDKNKNGRLDSDTEAHGFVAGVLRLDSTLSPQTLPILPSNTRELRLLGVRSLGHYAEVNYSKALANARLRALPNTLKIHYQYVKDKQNLRIYAPPHTDSLSVMAQVYDALGQSRTDTLSLHFEAAYLPPKALNFSIHTHPHPQFYGDSITWHLNFNKPIVAFRRDSIYRILPDSSRTDWQGVRLHWSATRERLILRDKVQKATKQVGLYVGANAFRSVEGDSTAVQYLFSARANEDHFGRVQGQIQVSPALAKVPLLLHLLNPKRDVMRRTQYPPNATKRPFDWRWLPPGKYFIRLIADADHNGRWTAGQLQKQQGHEELYLYPKAILIRANWWIEQLTIRFP